ncbi:hypothetical protein [Marinobacter sp. OP 3.4]|uniref:hypothetical protein n=1 Tax=Marinobacter sp. OP 3.4 TaxID=3076501 RepID=UPI002E1DCA6B
MSMTKDEWQNRRESMEYIESNRQYQTEKRLLDAVGYARGWLKRPVPKPDWFTQQCALARKLLNEGELRGLDGKVILTFEDVGGAVRRDQEYLPHALFAISKGNYQDGGKSLGHCLLSCAMQLVGDQREHFDANCRDDRYDDEGVPVDEQFHEHISGEEAA